MEPFSRDAESGVESQLIDLSSVPLAVLRRLDDTVLRQSLVHVVERIGSVHVSAEAGGAERID